ncbi:hypothetical protein KKH42_02530, partial [bacterium]|nr:hypothetical protein [bacterium]
YVGRPAIFLDGKINFTFLEFRPSQNLRAEGIFGKPQLLFLHLFRYNKSMKKKNVYIIAALTAPVKLPLLQSFYPSMPNALIL